MSEKFPEQEANSDVQSMRINEAGGIESESIEDAMASRTPEEIAADDARAAKAVEQREAHEAERRAEIHKEVDLLSRKETGEASPFSPQQVEAVKERIEGNTEEKPPNLIQRLLNRLG